MTTEYEVSAAELRQFVERIEALDAERRGVVETRREVMAEAKGRGYDTKAIRALVNLRQQKPDAVAEFEAVLDIYKAALGL